jgi:glucuronate isomerase
MSDAICLRSCFRVNGRASGFLADQGLSIYNGADGSLEKDIRVWIYSARVQWRFPIWCGRFHLLKPLSESYDGSKIKNKSIGAGIAMTDVYITEDFLLETDAARELFHDHAKDLPIVDYHCHLPPQEVAEDRRFDNLSQIWLAGDHYKWRAMRSNGVSEKYCTGDASDWEKFERWAATVPALLRNQLYPWTHLELKWPFGISDRLLGPDTAKYVWDACNEKLAQPEFSARGIMKRMKVVMVGTTDDPVDSLEAHKKVAADPDFNVLMLPTWRPDKGMAVDKLDVFVPWIERLEVCTNKDIRDLDAYREALRERQDYFHDAGCRISDHGIETAYAAEYTEAWIQSIFKKARDGKHLEAEEVHAFKSAMLYEFCRMNHEKGWAQQLHMGPIRNNNTRLYKQVGPDAGFDSIGDFPIAQSLARFLDRLDETEQLAKTVLYSLNPTHNMLLSTMIGNFQDGSAPGKMQYGSGWWFNDQKSGMEEQMEALSQVGLLSRFVGMLTDSRSFLSYPRHDYFRRILCNMLGNDICKGLIPNDIALAGKLVKDVSYYNAAAYFGLDLPKVD